MENIMKAWEQNGLEVNGAVLGLGYMAAAVLCYLTYIQVF